MAVRRVAADAPGGAQAIRKRFEREGLQPNSWSSQPGYRFGLHSHSREKLLYCVHGAIRFVSQDGAHDLAPGDRLEIAAGTDHSATVGPEGVECMEAFR